MLKKEEEFNHEVNEILEILTEEIPHQCRINKNSQEYTHHLNHIARRIVKIHTEKIEKMSKEKSINELSYMRIIKCLNEGNCKTKKKKNVEYVMFTKKMVGPYPHDSKLKKFTRIDIWEK